ncbi:MAG: c-type cytochrome biogenesis protein CcsB [Desulfatibacillaceae bacterium]
MTSSYILSFTTFAYCAAAVFFWAYWAFRKNGAATIGMVMSIAGFIANTWGIGMRWYESYEMGFGQPPFANMFDSLVLFSWTVVLLQLVIQARYRMRSLGGVTTPLAFLSLAYASLSSNVDDTIAPLIPALQSNWLTAHVITCFLGYAAFAVAFGISLLYLVKASGRDGGEGRVRSLLPKARILDELSYQNIMFGFLFLSVGIITGAVWANSAWGRYWSWDPKETWSLITWLIYATLIHFRLMRGWAGRRTAVLSIVGFAAILFTWFGVNYLLSGLHSYAT